MSNILPFSTEDIIDVLRKLLTAFKKIMAWLGVLVLPEDGEYDQYPTTTASDENNG